MIAYPEIDPVIFSIGPVALRWYGLMYVIGFMIGFQLIKKRGRDGMLTVPVKEQEALVTYVLIGMLIGARLAYVFIYNWHYYQDNLGEIFAVHRGGLAFHGAIVGIAVAAVVYARRLKIPLMMVWDTLAFAGTIGLFFGRIGNFINAELYGRETTLPWGMVFPSDEKQLVRHPSQLYQGLTEGVLLALIIWGLQYVLVKKGTYRQGYLACAFFIGYGVFRFMTEFAREPDAQLGFVLSFLSMGQVLCLMMVAFGVGLLYFVKRQSPIFRPKN